MPLSNSRCFPFSSSGCSIFENCKRCNNGTWRPRDDFFVKGQYCAECRPGWSGGDCLSKFLTLQFPCIQSNYIFKRPCSRNVFLFNMTVFAYNHDTVFFLLTISQLTWISIIILNSFTRMRTHWLGIKNTQLFLYQFHTVIPVSHQWPVLHTVLNISEMI